LLFSKVVESQKKEDGLIEHIPTSDWKIQHFSANPLPRLSSQKKRSRKRKLLSNQI